MKTFFSTVVLLLFAARVHTMLGYSEQMNPLTMQQHMTLIHPDERAGFASQWLRFLAAGGLITPAMWPEAPITKRFLPGSTCVLA